MAEVNLIIRTADRTHKAEVAVDRGQTVAELVESAIDKWNLPTDTSYSVSNVTRKTTMVTENRLSEDVISNNDVLEVEPVLLAGSMPRT